MRLNSGFSFHVCPRNEYFETLKLEEGGVVMTNLASVPIRFK